jgi:GTP-binding protein
MELRNIAIIAHVDHGKTTMVDQLLRQSGTFRDNQKVVDRVMDSNELERERGITILSKCTSVTRDGVRINIVDTPGHADFGGEVERILSMVDGVVILVDAAEGPMPQTKFVTTKALSLGLKPIVVINKSDRPDARHHEVHDEIFDLFLALDANEDQLDFPTLFASAKEGWAAESPEGPHDNLDPLFEMILKHVPVPVANYDEVAALPFAMLATTLERDNFLGRVLTGRIQQGVIKRNLTIKALNADGGLIQEARITKLLAFRGIERVSIEEAGPGDIVAIAGLSKATVADTLCELIITEPIPVQPIDPPTLSMTFSVNDSPLAGREGDKVTSRMLRDRLLREAEGNVAIQITDADNGDAFEVGGRGELQLGVLIETMRREGYEMSISRPRVVTKTDPKTGQRLEPIEEVMIDVDDEYSGAVMEKLGMRRAELLDMRPSGGGKTRMIFHAPTRGLIGYHSEFLTDTRGTGVMNRVFHDFAPSRGDVPRRQNGVLVATADGTSVPYALWNLEERGELFITSGVQVYQGMIIGENARTGDLNVNALKAKQLTNVRASGKDDAVRLSPHRRMSLEAALTYIEDDELVEVTPRSVRLRKRLLLPHERKRAARAAG